MAENSLQNIAKVNIIRNLSINQNFQNTAVRRTNVKSRAVFQQMISENNNVTPQDLGNVARRISIRSNQSKTPQDRFVDIFI